jgi:predicted enzyme related to lactoylglutathione lyase
MPVKSVLAGIPVADFDSALAWYERLLGRGADQRPMDGLAEWTFPGTGSIQVIADSERAGGGLLTLAVDDLRKEITQIEGRGLDFGSIDDQTSDKVLFATIVDPEGNAITMIEERR